MFIFTSHKRQSVRLIECLSSLVINVNVLGKLNVYLHKS